MRGRILVVALLAGACSDTGSSAMSGGGTGSGSGTAGDDAGMVDLQHGTVKLEFHRGAGVLGDPFDGTMAILVSLDYGTCLKDFYASNPTWAQAGPDGALVFGAAADGGEGWRDRLCTLGDVDCEVISFAQQLGATSSLRRNPSAS